MWDAARMKPQSGAVTLHWLGGAMGVLLALYLAFGTLLWSAQRSMIFPADPRPAVLDPATLPGVQAVTLHTADGERLVAWWAPPAREGAPVHLYLHGNGATLQARAGRFAWIVARGDGLLAVSWRGYGGSTGSPSEAGLMADARSAWLALTDAAEAGDRGARSDALGATPLPGRGPALPPSRVLLFGESIGTTVAVKLAAELSAAGQPPAALVLDSAFPSVEAIAREHYPFFPVGRLLRDPLRADLAAPAVTSPVLQIHCRDDPVTSRAAGERLHALLPRALPLVIVDGRCHTPPLHRFEAELGAFVARL
jgi:uncharacterized protein